MKLKDYLLFLLLPFFILSSCKKDQQLLDSSAKLGFSTDSVLFDTVFHYAGSTTKIFKIYNTHSQPMTISKAYLATGPASNFQLNVDGVSTTSSAPVIKDIEILAGDSLFVFVQVHVTPSGSSPLLIKDSIIFETNGNVQNVKLTAIGQDVYLIRPNHFPINGFSPYSIIGRAGHDTTLPNDKPYLVFGYAVVDSACICTIQPNTHMYFHNFASLYVYKDGTLLVNPLGSKGMEATFQGDRLEPDYTDSPGQWRGIWLSYLSKNNVINWAIIKNGTLGVQADTLNGTTPTVELTNTIIKNMQIAALYAQGAHVLSYNCVFANCGQYCAALAIGGTYRFEQCTFANFWTGTPTRTTSAVAINNYYTSGSSLLIRPIDSAYFGNCIIYGDLGNEVDLDSSTYSSSSFKFKFDHCLLKTTLNTSNPYHFSTIYTNTSPDFRNASINDYNMDAVTSFPVSKGYLSSITQDLNGITRPNPPALGAYEFH